MVEDETPVATACPQPMAGSHPAPQISPSLLWGRFAKRHWVGGGGRTARADPRRPITGRLGSRVALSGAAQLRSQFQREQQLIRRQLIHTRRNRIQDLRLSVAISRVDQKSALLKCLN